MWLLRSSTSFLLLTSDQIEDLEAPGFVLTTVYGTSSLKIASFLNKEGNSDFSLISLLAVNNKPLSDTGSLAETICKTRTGVGTTSPQVSIFKSLNVFGFIARKVTGRRVREFYFRPHQKFIDQETVVT